MVAFVILDTRPDFEVKCFVLRWRSSDDQDLVGIRHECRVEYGYASPKSGGVQDSEVQPEPKWVDHSKSLRYLALLHRSGFLELRVAAKVLGKVKLELQFRWRGMRSSRCMAVVVFPVTAD